MTRLTKHNLTGVEQQLKLYDLELMAKTGTNLGQIASFAAGVPESSLYQEVHDNRVSVIPITTGEGLIEGFVQSVRGIIRHLGFQASITGESDVAGLAEAMSSGSNIAFLADDRRFIAIDLYKGRFVDNAVATARGYVAALNSMAKGLKGKKVLVIGAGSVGTQAVYFLRELGALVTCFDIDQVKIQHLKNIAGIEIGQNLEVELPKHKFIFDATPQPAFIELEHLDAEAVIAAPGIPLGLTDQAFKACQQRVLHDPLQIGVAAMLAMAVSQNKIFWSITV